MRGFWQGQGLGNTLLTVQFHFTAREITARVYPFIAMLALCLGVAAGAQAQGAMPPPPVTVAQPLARRIVQWDEYTGRFEAVQHVDVRPRVSGSLESIHFTDGAVVHKGDKLFTIDPRPYQIALDSARADVLRTQAQVLRAGADFNRGQTLVKSATVTMRDLDQRRADYQVAQAQEQSAEAALRNAALNLEWTEVVAPISGRISDRRVDAGNLVSSSGDATLLTTIVSMAPIYFTFEAAEGDYIRYVRMSQAGQRPSSRGTANPVQVQLADETDWSHTGMMNFVDNVVNARSGTIRGRAVFDNKDLFFIPGTFGRMRLFGGYVNALLVPDAAISSDQAQKIIFAVGTNNVVEPRAVSLGGMAYGLRVITAGLKPDDKVIIGGLANPFVRPGAPVQPMPVQIQVAPDAASDELPAVTH